MSIVDSSTYWLSVLLALVCGLSAGAGVAFPLGYWAGRWPLHRGEGVGE
jgi:ABC-type nitrate/sulfonate/bicarbonate transport system permease component